MKGNVWMWKQEKERKVFRVTGVDDTRLPTLSRSQHVSTQILRKPLCESTEEPKTRDSPHPD